VSSNVKRIFVEKKQGFDVEAKHLQQDLKNNLRIRGLENVRIVYRYDMEGISDEIYAQARTTIFSEPPVDQVFDEKFDINAEDKAFAIEFLPGQYDQRADSASQCIQILTQAERTLIKNAKIVILSGTVSEEEFNKIKQYLINPVESREAGFEKPETLKEQLTQPDDVADVDGFIDFNEAGLNNILKEFGLAMDIDDLKFTQKYFKNEEKRNPTVTEMKILDTYWSDHCRHTTFLTRIDDVEFEDGKYSNKIKEVYQQYLESRKFVYGDREKDVCLMDIATIAVKELKKQGKLDGLDESEEINACSIQVKANVNGKEEDWLVMFKNETHNHPTEIEPFGGAATCLGGAIRDPLSGRSYVYQAMRVTGAADPRQPIEETLPGKLSQRQICTVAAHGYSSYGNQIGLSTGFVDELYHPGYVAKRMEVGAVIAAAPKFNVVRKSPEPGDVVVLLGGKTGRDGCGGATGSSKAHTDESLVSCGSEVQKGNAPEERKIQRLFRNADVTRMIKRCNDFGAGGVSVAIGELADGLEINLDMVPKKYEGLDGTELAISESQERMACVIAKENEEAFKKAAKRENLEAVTVAVVKEEPRVKIFWRGKTIVNLSREFVDSNGASKNTTLKVTEPAEKSCFDKKYSNCLKEQWLENISDLNVCSKKGLVEMFDNSVGASTVNYPFGGLHQLTPAESMVAKLPMLDEETTTASVMSYGFDPYLSSWSPFHGAVYAVVESVAKIVAAGGDYKSTWFSFQEYFERLGNNPERWGKPFSALLGAYYAQSKFERAAIGGKDSMSGTFNDIDVPPTLISFAVDTMDAGSTISPEFKKAGNQVVYLPVEKDEHNLPVFESLLKNYETVTKLISEKKVISAHTVKAKGIAEAVSKMTFGNRIGFEFSGKVNSEMLFSPGFGGIVMELAENQAAETLFESSKIEILGKTTENEEVSFNGEVLALKELIARWTGTLEDIFPTKTENEPKVYEKYKFEAPTVITPSEKFAKPRVLVPAFPGTNSEYDSAKCFNQAGGEATILPVRNLTAEMIDDTIEEMVKEINNSQIIMIPGGFSAGDEPEGSGKFIATMFRNPKVSDAVNNLLKNRDGLVLGICNGFQALIKLGLVPYGEIRNIEEDAPTLTFNKIGRHIAHLIRTEVTSSLSPWFANIKPGTVQTIPVSHGEGRFVASDEWIEKLKANGQIATRYVDLDGNPTSDNRFNPNGSYFAIEGITSPDGRVLGKMAHNERLGANVAKNIPGNKDIELFKAGVNYFK